MYQLRTSTRLAHMGGPLPRTTTPDYSYLWSSRAQYVAVTPHDPTTTNNECMTDSAEHSDLIGRRDPLEGLTYNWITTTTSYCIYLHHVLTIASQAEASHAKSPRPSDPLDGPCFN